MIIKTPKPNPYVRVGLVWALAGAVGLAAGVLASGCAHTQNGPTVDEARNYVSASGVLLDVASAQCEAIAPTPREHPCASIAEARRVHAKARQLVALAEGDRDALAAVLSELAELTDTLRGVVLDAD